MKQVSSRIGCMWWPKIELVMYSLPCADKLMHRMTTAYALVRQSLLEAAKVQNGTVL